VSGNVFGWSLPPGVTDSMIEDAFGERPGFIEGFEEAKGKGLSPEANETLGRLYDDEDMSLLVEEIAAWACSEGHREAAEDRAMEPPDTLQAALESIAFDCEVALRDGGYDGVVPTIHETAQAAIKDTKKETRP